MANRREMALEDARNVQGYVNYLTDDELSELVVNLQGDLDARRRVRRNLALRMVVFELEGLATELAQHGLPGFPYRLPTFHGPRQEDKDKTIAKIEALRARFVELQDASDDVLEEMDKA